LHRWPYLLAVARPTTTGTTRCCSPYYPPKVPAQPPQPPPPEGPTPPLRQGGSQKSFWRRLARRRCSRGVSSRIRSSARHSRIRSRGVSSRIHSSPCSSPRGQGHVAPCLPLRQGGRPVRPLCRLLHLRLCGPRMGSPRCVIGKGIRLRPCYGCFVESCGPSRLLLVSRAHG
jgi:hypothetical protein